MSARPAAAAPNSKVARVRIRRACLRFRAGQPVGPLDDAGDLHARVGPELGEDVADVGLDGLGAEEQLLGDLAVGLAVDDAAGDFELALGERVDPCAVRNPGLRAPVDVLPELPELAFGRISVALRANGVQRLSSTLELTLRTVAIAGPRERLARKRARQGRLDRQSRCGTHCCRQLGSPPRDCGRTDH